MSPVDARFGSQDYQLTQSHNTIAYARALQHWAEKAQPPIPSQPCCLAKSVMELQQAMELLVLFMEEGVFTAMASSNWMEVSSPGLLEPISQDSHPDSSCSHSSSHSHSQNGQVCPRDPCQEPEVKADLLPLPGWMQQQVPYHLLGFAEIVQAPWGEEPKERGPQSIISVPPEEVINPYEVMGSVVMANCLLWHSTMGEVFIDIQLCALRIVGLGLDPLAGDHPALTLQELTELD